MSHTVVLLGGSFDPPHVAHVMASAYALSATAADAAWWLPVARHAFPHKRQQVSFEHRVAMCRLALLPFGERAKVCDIEGRHSGVSYTVDTLEALHEAHPELAFRLVIGSDVLEEKHLWKDFDRVCQLAPLVVLSRPGFPVPAGQPASPPTALVSSSEVRARFGAGQDCSTLVPAQVLAYIEKNQLYPRETE